MVMRRRIGPILKYSTKGNYCSLVRFHKTLESITMLTIFFAKSFKPLATSMAAAAQLSVKAYSHTTIIQ